MNSETYLIITYLIYGAVAVGLTMWLARTLFANGATFLEEIFDRPEFAHAVNRLLVTGFYMLNLGYAFLILQGEPTETAVDAAELLITKLGLLLVSLGVIHFINMGVFWYIRSRALAVDDFPLPPTSTLAPPPAVPNY